MEFEVNGVSRCAREPRDSSLPCAHGQAPQLRPMPMHIAIAFQLCWVLVFARGVGATQLRVFFNLLYSVCSLLLLCGMVSRVHV